MSIDKVDPQNLKPDIAPTAISTTTVTACRALARRISNDPRDGRVATAEARGAAVTRSAVRLAQRAATPLIVENATDCRKRMRSDARLTVSATPKQRVRRDMSPTRERVVESPSEGSTARGLGVTLRQVVNGG